MEKEVVNPLLQVVKGGGVHGMYGRFESLNEILGQPIRLWMAWCRKHMSNAGHASGRFWTLPFLKSAFRPFFSLELYMAG